MRSPAFARPASWALAAFLVVTATQVQADEPLTFPPAADGRRVVPVDLHVHTVFSDGSVWPTIRVDEAVREGLGAIAITDHLEFAPKAPDVVSIDKNRAYQIASDYAGDRLGVIRGAEITRRKPIGHVVATFLKDANPLLTTPTTSTVAELIAAPAYQDSDSFVRALEEAKSQGGFVFWAHPIDPPSSTRGPAVQREQERIIADGLIQGVEVANPHWGIMWEGIEIARKYDLAFIGVSDVHKTIEMHNAELANEHRSITLVLARDAGLTGISNALQEKATIALYNNTFIGRRGDLELLIRGFLTVESVKKASFDDGLVIRIKNEAPTPMRLRSIDNASVEAVFGEIDIAPRSQREVAVRLQNRTEFTGADVKILNAFTETGENLRIRLEPRPDPTVGGR